MRIASGTTDQYIYFVAVDATDYVSRETGLSSFTVYRSRNGGAAAAMTTPTINETDNTNMPGVYELLLDEDMTIDSGDDTQEMVFHITHAGMAPVTRTIELYRPKITAGNTLDVTETGAAGIDWGNVENQTTTVNLSATTIDTDQVVASVAGAVGSVTGNVGGNVTGSVGSVETGGITAASIATGAIDADAIASDAVTEIQSGLATALALSTVAGYLDTEIAAILADTNELQTDWADGGRLDLLIDAIRAKTDSLTFTVAGNVDANIQRINDVTVNGDGSGTPWGP